MTMKLKKDLDDYVVKTLNLGYQAPKIKNTLLGAGWPEDEVDKQLSEVMKNKSW